MYTKNTAFYTTGIEIIYCRITIQMILKNLLKAKNIVV